MLLQLYLEGAPNFKTWLQLTNITITIIKNSILNSSFDDLSKWHDPDLKCRWKGCNVLALYKNITEHLLSFRKCSVEADPRVPWLKLSMNRTVFFSKGIVVPPEVTKTMRCFRFASQNFLRAVWLFSRRFWFGGGFSLKKVSQSSAIVGAADFWSSDMLLQLKSEIKWTLFVLGLNAAVLCSSSSRASTNIQRLRNQDKRQVWFFFSYDNHIWMLRADKIL